MKYLESLDTKQKIIAISVILFMVITIICYGIKKIKERDNYLQEEIYALNDIENVNSIDNEISNLDDTFAKENKTIIVYVAGEVNNVGLVELEEGNRISDAIEKAGGLKESADISQINMAYQMQDGEKLFIPSKEKIENEEKEVAYVTKENGNGIVSSGSNKSEASSKKININNASKEELMKVPGIGESTANKIINYREQNNKFKNIEELKNIPGIGDSKFENMKEKICI